MKKQSSSGITLIALVITIIVLLILAGVSISMVIGDNGILNQAQEAKDKTEEASLKEEVELAIQDKLIEDLSKTGNTSLKDILERNINSDAQVETGPTLGDGKETYYVTKGDETITVYPDGTMEIGRVDFWDGTSSSQPSYDSTNNSIIINTAAELNYLAQHVNGTLTNSSFTINENTTIYLNANIDLQGHPWTPINQFSAIFDGNNNFVKNVNVDTTANFAGFFGRTSNTIKNLTIKDSTIEGGNCMGGIAGLGVTIENCHNVNTSVTSKEGSYNTIGGIVGQVQYIRNCTNSGAVTANGYTPNQTPTDKSDCGGIAGAINKEATGCTNTGTVQSIGARVGGIAGIMAENATDCHNAGEVTGAKDFVGGIAGQLNAKAKLKNCSNTSTITGKGFYTGGIVGAMNNTSTDDITLIEKCYNSGVVKGFTSVGGILGRIYGEANVATVQYCYNKGQVTNTGNHLGSIIGEEVPTSAGKNDLNHLYYLASLELEAIAGSGAAADDEGNFVMPVDDNLNSYRDFVIWINNK